MKKSLIMLAFGISLAAISSSPYAFPLGISAIGGVGVASYSMSELNEHIGLLGQESHLTIDELSNGINFRAEGRIWYRRVAALAGGYQHFWGETGAGETSSLSYSTPADIYSLGAIFSIFEIAKAMDLCLGINHCWASAVLGTNEFSGRRLTEFKGQNRGFEAYAEIHTSFLSPLEVGVQLGYRGLKIDTLEDRFGRTAYFDSVTRMSLDYSGVFFFLFTSIRIN